MILGYLLFFGSCSLESGRSVEEIQKSGKLIILTRNAPTTYYFDSKDQATGPEYEMAEAFAKNLGVETEYRTFNTIHEILDALENGQGDLAAAGIIKTKIRNTRFLFGPVYEEVQQQIVCRNGVKHVREMNDLVGLKVVVPKHSSYEETLNKFKAGLPNLTWESTDQVNSEQLFEKMLHAEIDCTAVDSNITSINRRYFPELIVAFELTQSEPLAWVLPPKNSALQKALEAWFRVFNSNDELNQIKERYYGFIKKFDFVDTVAFHNAIEERYSKYQHIFDEAAKQHDLDKFLLAAHSYQESHWKPKARSPTGVRGIMMLTLPTAKSLGVKSRLNPYENIMAGAKHFSDLLKSFNQEVTEPDRTWLALAAYNVGRGHLHDAQELARRMEKNPYLWSDIRSVLPLLSKKKYYKTLKYGYARGHEPVRYVQRIRNYSDILQNKFPQEQLIEID
ncbi:MAG: membrane-bound lytic murein transglycosylase F [Nitrospinales bacterium]|jgi:membrane-bound lytic murein transglycosylase F